MTGGIRYSALLLSGGFSFALCLVPISGFSAPIPSAVQSAIARLPWGENEQSHQPSLTFTSAESRGIKDSSVTNRIQFNEVGSYDIWRMRQRSSGEGAEYTSWSHIAIVVDTAVSPKQAYYFEFAPKPVASGDLPQFIAPRVDCVRCHPSGPRLIRPLTSDKGKASSKEDIALMQRWNRKIESYGVVNHDAQAQSASGGRMSERLTWSVCADCHDSRGTIRGDLNRYNRGSIEFLVEHREAHETRGKAAMPKDEPQLNAMQKKCLTDWLNGRAMAVRCLEEKKIASPSSGLIATVKTSVSQFEVHAPAAQGTMRCSSESCRLTIVSSVEKWSSGIDLRDTHLRQRVFGSANHEIQVDIEGIPKNLIDAGFKAKPFTVALAAAGGRSKQSAVVSCTPRNQSVSRLECHLDSMKWDVRSSGIQPPRMLWIAVEPVVAITGTIAVELVEFRKP